MMKLGTGLCQFRAYHMLVGPSESITDKAHNGCVPTRSEATDLRRCRAGRQIDPADRNFAAAPSREVQQRSMKKRTR